MDLVEFYSKLLRCFEIYENPETGYLVNEEGEPVLSIDEQIPFTLPTRKGLNTIMTRKDGKLIQDHEIFNPLREMAIGGTPASDVVFFSTVISHTISNWIEEAIWNIVDSVDGDKVLLGKREILRVNTILSEIEGVKDSPVDKNTHKNLKKIFKELYKDEGELVTIWINKGKSLAGSGYVRMATLVFRILEKLEESGAAKKYRVRKKDIALVTHLLRGIFQEMDEEPVLKFGTILEDGTSFDALIELVTTVQDTLSGFRPDKDYCDILSEFPKTRSKLMEQATVIVNASPTKRNTNPKNTRQTHRRPQNTNIENRDKHKETKMTKAFDEVFGNRSKNTSVPQGQYQNPGFANMNNSAHPPQQQIQQQPHNQQHQPQQQYSQPYPPQQLPQQQWYQPQTFGHPQQPYQSSPQQWQQSQQQWSPQQPVPQTFGQPQYPQQQPYQPPQQPVSQTFGQFPSRPMW